METTGTPEQPKATRTRRRRWFAAAVAAAALAPVAPASAAPVWHDGTIEGSTVLNCNFLPEGGVQANAQFEADPAALPRVGDVFYVRTMPARVGHGCGTDMAVHVELVLPAGLAPAISASTPVRCRLWDFAADTATTLDGCPQEPQAGLHGLAFDQLTPGGPHPTTPWVLPYRHAVVVEVPLRASRAFKGAAGGSPSCGRAEGQPPCRADQLGDHVQFANGVIDGWDSPWLSPDVGVFVEGGGSGPAPAPGPAGAPVPSPAGAAPVAVTAPERASLRALRRGLRVRVAVPAAGSTVTARLRLGGRTLARGRVRNAAAGTAVVRLRPTRAGRSARRAGRAVLRVSVTGRDGTRASATAPVLLRR